MIFTHRASLPAVSALVSSPVPSLLSTVLSTFVMVLIWTSVAAAQDVSRALGVITGTIVDARTGQPLPGVLVELRKPAQAVVTDGEGRFRLDAVPAGTHELYVSLVGYALAKRDVTVTSGEASVSIALSEGTAAYDETVTVRGDVFGARETGVAGQQSLGSAELRQLGGMTLDDPLRAVQTLAGVNASDDFSSEMAIRGSGFRHVNYTLDGVPARFLQHTIEAVEDGGSVAMINSDVLDRVTLLRGAYPQRDGTRLGAELAFATREGSRQRPRYNLTASGTSASVTAEGPFGASARGSWLVSARRSYLDLLLDRVLDDASVAFGFTDVFAKTVYDVSDTHQVQATLLAGRSDFSDDVPADEALEDATHNGWLASAAWRHTVSSSLTLTHRAFFLGESYRNRNGLGIDIARGRARDYGYRADVAYSSGAGRLIEGGFSVNRQRERQQHAFAIPSWRVLGGEDFDAQATAVGAYGQVRWTTGAITFTPGARVDRSGLTDEWAASPWLQVDWQMRRDMAIVGGVGLHHQFPDFVQVVGRRGQAGLDPERALHVDVGVEGRLTAATRWQVTVYDREEKDVLDLPGLYFRLVGGDALQGPSATSRFENRLEGSSRGVELMLQRKSPDALSGWIAYSYGRTRYADRVTGERFDGDNDQRHTISVFGRYRLSERTSVNARWRYGSNRPILGYVDRRSGGQFFVGTERNTTRVPAYSRLDIRADRTFRWGPRRLTLFGEVMNVLNRDNERQIPPFVNLRTGELFPFESTLPIVPSIGLTVEF